MFGGDTNLYFVCQCLRVQIDVHYSLSPFTWHLLILRDIILKISFINNIMSYVIKFMPLETLLKYESDDIIL